MTNDLGTVDQTLRAPHDPMRGNALGGQMRRVPGRLAGYAAKGVFAMFAAAQAINLATRQQFTWQNKEEGHKLDAFIPGGRRGIWFSPFSSIPRPPIWQSARTSAVSPRGGPRGANPPHGQ